MALNQLMQIYIIVACTIVPLASSTVEQDTSLPTPKYCKEEDWVEYSSLLAVAGWGSFVIATVCLLSGLCVVKQRRVRAESELFNLRTTNRQRMLVIPDHRAGQTTANISNTPAAASNANEAGGEAKRPYLSSGGTSYYPPTSTAFECTGQRWAPAKNMPAF